MYFSPSVTSTSASPLTLAAIFLSVISVHTISAIAMPLSSSPPHLFPRVVPAEKLRQFFSAALRPRHWDDPWAAVLDRLISSDSASDRQWVAHRDGSTGCVAHVIPNGRNSDERKVSLWKIRLIAFACLGRGGGHVYDDRGTNLQPDAPEDGNFPPTCLAGVHAAGGIRLLVQSDAELIDSRWEYSSAGSLQTIRGLIGSKKGCCLGVETAEDGQLAAWVLQYLDGSISMLWCERDHRRSGLAGSLLLVATERGLKSGGDGFAYATRSKGTGRAKEYFGNSGGNRRHLQTGLDIRDGLLHHRNAR